MDLGIKGRAALITGADSGIGWHTAQRLLHEGAKVFLTGQEDDKLTEAVQQLDGPGNSIHHGAADVTDVDALAMLHSKVREAVGDIDILVHAAGITGAQGLFHEIDDEGWVHTLEVDLMGAVRVAREFIQPLRRGGWGRLIFISSEDAVQPYDNELPYCAAKAGIVALSKGLSRSYAREGLLVNVVSPAFIHTPMTDVKMAKRAEDLGVTRAEAIEGFLAQERPFLELKRRGEPHEVADVIAFLCSDLASFVVGSNWRVDGGSVATI